MNRIIIPSDERQTVLNTDHNIKQAGLVAKHQKKADHIG